MQRRSKSRSTAAAAPSEPDFSLDACRQCLSEIGAELTAVTAAPDSDAAAVARLCRSFSQLNWMMSSQGTKWKPQLKSDLRLIEQEMLDSGLVTRLVDLLLALLRFKGAYDELAVRVLLSLLNCTDRSLDFCLSFAKSHDKFFSAYFPNLLTAQEGGRMLELNAASLVECAMGIGYNMYFKNDSELYRRLAEYPGLVDNAKPYLTSPVTRVSATALIFIAFAVDESRPEIFLGAKKSINYLISILRLGLKAPERACDGYSVAEMSKSINRLALNDANKDLLMELNVLSVVKLMLDSAEAQDVQDGLEILFTLSFSQRAAERIKTEFRDHIERLQTAEQWRNASQLRGLAFRLLGGERGQARQAEQRSRRVMLSYNHASKQQVERLHSRLCESHLDVWVDFKHLKEGSTLDAMSAAVESSQVVLLCVTRLYKESNNCRLEAEYAWKCGKKLIPVLMEPKYKATGWLGMLLGTQLYFDLTEAKYPFEEKFSQLLPVILTCLDSAPPESPGHQQHRLPTPASPLPPIAASAIPVTGAAPAAAVTSDIQAWDADRVALWCSESGLPQQVADMRLTGRELRFLLSAMARSPEFFGRLLERYFGFARLHDMAALVTALEDLARTGWTT